MQDFFLWFTDLNNSKTAAAVIFFSLFVFIIIYVFTGKKRKEKYDRYRFIPLEDGDDDVFTKKARDLEDKVEKNEDLKEE